MRIKPLFKWYDLWVGFFYDRDFKRLYILPLPTLGICIHFKSIFYEQGVMAYKKASDYNCGTIAYGTETKEALDWQKGYNNIKVKTEIFC